MEVFFVAGIGLATFIEFLLISKKNKSESDRILTLWMFLILLHLAVFYSFYSGAVVKYFPFLLGIEHPLPLFHGVFLYLYVCSVTGQLPEKRWLVAFHFLPATVLYALLIPWFSLSSEQKIAVYMNQGAGYEWYITLKSYAITFSGVIYVAWSALLLRRHGRTIRERFSDLDKINLRWLQILTAGLGCIWLLVLIFQNDTLVFTGVVVFVFLIGFFGVRQVDIFAHGPTAPQDDDQLPEAADQAKIPGKADHDVPEDADQEPPEEADQKEKYAKSGLTEEASGQLHQALIRLMTEDAAYRKSDLSIDDLSSRLGVHPNYLSQVINQREKKNFYDFVNTYRIEEFKRLIAIPRNQQYTLLSLAYDCGFSSKSSFNRYFKKVTRQTPSQYTTTLSSSQITPS